MLTLFRSIFSIAVSSVLRPKLHEQQFKHCGFKSNQPFSRRLATLLVLCFALLQTTALHAGKVKKIASRAGISPLQSIRKTAPNVALMLFDEEYNYMVGHPLSSGTPWTNVFQVPFVGGSNTIRDAYTNVVLRYDESKANFHAAVWSIKIEYDLKTWDGINATATTYANEQMTIGYDPAAPYTDKVFKRYANSFRSELVIKNVWINNVLQNGSLPSKYDDVYLDLEQETTRYYVLNTTTQPQVKVF
ncbi:MAG: hypothetical protein ACRCYO_06690, partial [Bacteroidia bacterium]